MDLCAGRYLTDGYGIFRIREVTENKVISDLVVDICMYKVSSDYWVDKDVLLQRLGDPNVHLFDMWWL